MSKKQQHRQCNEPHSLEGLMQCVKEGHDVLVLMRGVPGSGKSRLASELKALYDGGVIYSTDDFFMKNGEYRFDLEMLEEHHKANVKRARDAMHPTRGLKPIIIDNTNIRLEHMRQYTQHAVNRYYEIYVIEPTTEWAKSAGKCARKNSHGVTKEQIRQMLDELEDLRRPTLQQLVGPDVEPLIEKFDNIDDDDDDYIVAAAPVLKPVCKAESSAAFSLALSSMAPAPAAAPVSLAPPPPPPGLEYLAVPSTSSTSLSASQTISSATTPSSSREVSPDPPPGLDDFCYKEVSPPPIETVTENYREELSSNRFAAPLSFSQLVHASPSTSNNIKVQTTINGTPYQNGKTRISVFDLPTDDIPGPSSMPTSSTTSFSSDNHLPASVIQPSSFFNSPPPTVQMRVVQTQTEHLLSVLNSADGHIDVMVADEFTKDLTSSLLPKESSGIDAKSIQTEKDRLTKEEFELSQLMTMFSESSELDIVHWYEQYGLETTAAILRMRQPHHPRLRVADELWRFPSSKYMGTDNDEELGIASDANDALASGKDVHVHALPTTTAFCYSNGGSSSDRPASVSPLERDVSSCSSSSYYSMKTMSPAPFVPVIPRDLLEEQQMVKVPVELSEQMRDTMIAFCGDSVESAPSTSSASLPLWLLNLVHRAWQGEDLPRYQEARQIPIDVIEEDEVEDTEEADARLARQLQEEEERAARGSDNLSAAAHFPPPMSLAHSHNLDLLQQMFDVYRVPAVEVEALFKAYHYDSKSTEESLREQLGLSVDEVNQRRRLAKSGQNMRKSSSASSICSTATRRLAPSTVPTYSSSASTSTAPSRLTAEQSRQLQLQSVQNASAKLAQLVPLERKAHEKRLQANNYVTKGKFGAATAAFYSQEARDMTRRQLQDRAVAVQEVKDAHEFTRDMELHQLTTIEAVAAVKWRLTQRDRPLQRRGGPARSTASFLVITGRGKNSQNGKAALRNAIVSHLRQNQYEYSFENDGAIRVWPK